MKAILLLFAVTLAASLAGCGGSGDDGESPADASRAVPSASGGRPPASWRPFADDSPWNQRIPAHPRIDRRSKQFVNRLLADDRVEPLRVGIADTPLDFSHAIYFAKDSDPLYRIRGGSKIDPYRIDGERVRMPDGARPAAGADHHLAVVYDGEHWGCYNARVQREPRVITCEAGRKVPIDGVGLHAADTAARFPSLAGRIRYQELAAAKIRHALFAASSRIAYTWVYPAEKSDGGNNPQQGYPPMGSRFQLDPAYMTNARLATYPPWKRAVLRAIRDYGFYLGDSTDRGLKVFPIESGTSYTSLGRPDPWVRYAKAHDIPSTFDEIVDRTVYEFDLEDGVDWSRLRAIHPCLASKDC
jgi:hypothetical protein